VPASLPAVAALFRETAETETHWISALQETDLDREMTTQFIPGRTFSVAQGLMQVCLHTQGHRAQCAVKLRALGGKPPSMDFIGWVKERPNPDWA